MDRSEIMRRVRSKDTIPEMVIRRLIFSLGYRYRLHREDLPGKPDIVFPSTKKILFVHGCFWHGHACKRGARIPKKNRQYWVRKITRNMERDKNHQVELKKLGWRVQVIWECEIKNLDEIKDKIEEFISGGGG